MLKGETHSSPETARDGRAHSTPRLLEVMDFLECNIGDIDWNVRMPNDPPVVDPKARKLPEQCKEGDATLILTFPMTGDQHPH